MLSRQLDMVKWLVGVVITVAGILALSWAIEEEGNLSRVPAMIHDSKPVPLEQEHALPQPQKEAILQMGRELRKPHLAKASGILDVEITAPAKGVAGTGSIIDLEARVEAQSNLDGLKYVWILPTDGVTIISGHQEDDIGSMTEGQTTVIHLSVQSQTAENRQIHLNVFKMVDGEPLGKMAQYNTVNQESIEALAQSKAAALQNAPSNSDSPQKLIQ
jgi:hypothetical protein